MIICKIHFIRYQKYFCRRVLVVRSSRIANVSHTPRHRGIATMWCIDKTHCIGTRIAISAHLPPACAYHINMT